MKEDCTARMKSKGKVNLSCERNEDVWGTEGMALLIFNLSTRRSTVVRFTLGRFILGTH
jgi:hypothetical protein